MSTERISLLELSDVKFANPTIIGQLPGLPNFPPSSEKTPTGHYCAYAPLVTAKLVYDEIRKEELIVIRFTLLIDSSIVIAPTHDGYLINKSIGEIIFTYSSKNIIPTGIINVWYCELLCYNQFTTIEAFLCDTDPVTSRGTVTTVQQA